MADKIKMSSSRRYELKSLMLQIGEQLVEQAALELVEEERRYMEENCPPLSIPGSQQELQELCKKFHKEIDLADDERYDSEIKSTKNNKDIDELKMKIRDLNGKFKKPALKKVRMSADQMLEALLGNKRTNKTDFKSNLKQVKKEVKEEEVAGDWRKNVEDKAEAGMDGRKKLFESETITA